LDQTTDRQVLMSDSEDNSVTHEQEVQALIDELTSTDLQYSEEDSSEPFLQQEDSDEELATTTIEPAVTMTKALSTRLTP
jgi:hypothetical protein